MEKNTLRNQRLRILLSKISASISTLSIVVWTYLFIHLYSLLSRKEMYSILILLGNDLFRIGLSGIEHSTDKYLYLRAMPMVIQIILGKRSVIHKLIHSHPKLTSWLRLLQAIYYSNLFVDILFTLFAGLYTLDSKIIFMSFLEVLLI